MASGEPFCQAECHHLATMRWSWGTRHVVCTSEADIFTFVRKHNPGLGEPSFPNLWSCFKAFTDKDVADFTQDGHHICSTT
eukprot:12886181-Prorocentrum_lima.AAC.1